VEAVEEGGEERDAAGIVSTNDVIASKFVNALSWRNFLVSHLSSRFPSSLFFAFSFAFAFISLLLDNYIELAQLAVLSMLHRTFFFRHTCL
jgi:hypothetical protein